MQSASNRDSSFVVDALLFLTVTIWAVNFPLVKLILIELPPFGFNLARLVGASAVLMAICFLFSDTPRVDRADWGRLLIISFVGHTCYQTLFVSGVHRTTATNSAILLGLTPVFVSILSFVTGEERQSLRVWLGVGVSFVGVSLVLHDSTAGAGSVSGDLIILGSTLCWSVYTVIGKPLVRKYGSIATTAYSLGIGSVLFLPLGVSSLVEIEWGNVTGFAWLGTTASLLGALVAAYLIWYYALGRVGPTRTAIYANLTPVMTMIVSYVWIDEHIGLAQIAGTAIILSGIFLVRRARQL